MASLCVGSILCELQEIVLGEASRPLASNINTPRRRERKRVFSVLSAHARYYGCAVSSGQHTKGEKWNRNPQLDTHLSSSCGRSFLEPDSSRGFRWVDQDKGIDVSYAGLFRLWFPPS